MAKTEQKITIIGRVGVNDGLKHANREGGKDYCRVSVVVDEPSGNSTWFKVTAFEATAKELAEKATKGALVKISGRVSANAYLAEGGVPAASLNIAASSFELLPSESKPVDKPETPRAEAAEPAASAPAAAQEPSEAEKALVKPILALVKSGDLSLKKAREQIQKMKISDVAKDRAVARAEQLAA